MVATENALLPSERCRRLLLRDVHAGDRVLDVGCGQGELLREYAARGCRVAGVEVCPQLVAELRAEGLDVQLGTAEQLPFRDGDFDRIVCSVVIPYTDEREAIREWSRVLRPGGVALATYHGLGYGCNYLLRGDSFKRRIYGARMLANTGYYRWTASRLPGFWGDTLCQTPGRLQTYYQAAGLILESEEVMDLCCGQPRFFGHVLRKPG